MAGPDRERESQDRRREQFVADRDRAEQSKRMRVERTRHDAIGLAQDILDPRIRAPEAVLPGVVLLMHVAAKDGGSLSPYETNPIRDAFLIRAFAGSAEKIQVKQVKALNAKMETMRTNPVLELAIQKWEASYDPDIGDIPKGLSADEWKAYGDYVAERDERDAIVDQMTNGVAGLYGDKADLERRIARNMGRLEGLKSRAGTLNSDETKQYMVLLAKMFEKLKGPEAEKYTRLSGLAPEDLKPEEQVMLQDIWQRMAEALDGGEQAEKDYLEQLGTSPLSPDLQRLYDRRLRQIQDVITDSDERAEFDRLMAIPTARLSEDEADTLAAKLELAAEDAKIATGELETFRGIKRRKERKERLDELKAKETAEGLTTGERGTFMALHKKAGTLTEAEIASIKTIEELVVNLTERAKDVDKQIEVKSKDLKVSEKWLDMYKAFNGMVSNINVTDQWRRGWHDVGASISLFTETRWTEYQKVSEFVKLLELNGVGPAIKEAFRAMVLIGMNRCKEVGKGAENIMQMEKLTDDDIKTKFIDPVAAYVKGKLGAEAEDLYVDFGVEMARMFFENSFCAGYFCVDRDEKGAIKYAMWDEATNKPINDERVSSSSNSDAYKYAVPLAMGDGTTYPDRMNDYVKFMATRAKMMKEFANAYETGLPALMPVLPDQLAFAWLSPDDLKLIADGKMDLREFFVGKTIPVGNGAPIEVKKQTENARWFKGYGWFRDGQVWEMVSKFVVGLKGFRGIAEEVTFFLKSPSNLGSLSKKIDVALGWSTAENRRFRMNFAMALLYSVRERAANPNWKTELKTVLANRGDGGMDESLFELLISDKKDDIGRLFVERAGFVTENEWSTIWDRVQPLGTPEDRVPGVKVGGKKGVGMIKFEENVTKPVDVERARGKRRRQLADQV